MATITIEVPDELAPELEQLRDRLAEVVLLSVHQPPVPASIYRAIVDFLANAPSPAEVVAFHPTAAMRSRLATLLARNTHGDLTSAEQQELAEFERIEHLMILLKAGSLAHLTASS